MGTVMGATAAVFAKEVREQFLRSGRPALSFWVQVAFDVVIGVGVPFFAFMLASDAPRSLQIPTFMAFTVAMGVGILSFVGLFSPMSTIVDAIAGERERHTLETLLASPLPDHAILWGKMLPAFAAVLAHVVVTATVVAITAAILVGPMGLLAALLVLVLGVPAALVTCSVYTGIGMLISMRASTVKQGQQWLMYASLPLMLPFMLIGVWLPRLSSAMVGLAETVPWIAGTVFLALGGLMLALVHVAFRRDRLLAGAR